MAFPASRTGLSRWGKAVNFDDRLAALERHPFQNGHEAAKAQVAHLPSPHRFHAAQVQILKVQHIVFIAQPIRQLKVMTAPFVSHVCAVLCQAAASAFVVMRPFHLARKLTVEQAYFAQPLREKLRTAVGSAFIVGEKSLETKVEAAAFTRADSADSHFLDDTENQPQPPNRIALDGERFNLPCHIAVFHKFVLCPVDCDGVAFHLVARLWEGERSIFLDLLELRTTCQFVKKALVSIIDPLAYLLTGL